MANRLHLQTSTVSVLLLVSLCHSAARDQASASPDQTSVSPAGLIEWSKDVKLTPRDFRSKAASTGIDTAHSWVGLDVWWECREGEASSRARAIFDPDRSWWRSAVANIWGGFDTASISRSELENRRTPAQRDDDLLRHEQLHFDLTELAARRLRRQFETLPRVCASPGGSARLDDDIAAIEREWLDEQARYDQDTGHGANRIEQKQWEVRVGRALDKP